MGESTRPETSVRVSTSNTSHADAWTFARMWPPANWPMMEDIKAPFASAEAPLPKHSHASSQAYLSYGVSINPEHGAEGIAYPLYTLSVTGHMSGMEGETSFPVIKLDFYGWDAREGHFQDHIKSISVRGHDLAITRDSAMRAVMAATHLAVRIVNSTAPNADRILKIYRLG